MGDDTCKKTKVSWSKTVTKWFNFKNRAEDFHADEFSHGEDNGPAKKWLELIRRTLNSLPGTSARNPTDSDFEGSIIETNPSFLNRHAFQSLSRSMRIIEHDVQQPGLDRRYSVSDRIMFRNRTNGYDPNLRSSDEDNGPDDSPDSVPYCDKRAGNSRYCLVASKQMGSISISMSLHQTSFCFICCHLTSGQKEGDELRRNADVMEILRKTWFPRVEGTRDEKSPQTILEHE
ncbi:Endonuclease/exonuclease/phosphatase [Cynara cardunculus var. scolymus]|uniref:Endonuclease/exonuclease/phosphatase n=1 Tax=Cynara cardunculus var. scolymus TaxID=59895 RepID=A0A103YNI6_CYNCS|nr:Endonuclease/exonuclease/phosphatase [Cynara cardunculus var. scolymus]